jgi:hypothetical protein
MSLTKTSNQVIQTPYKKNFIINGAMDIWQAGTSFTAITTGPIADMCRYGQSNDGNMDILRSTTVPTIANGATFEPNYSLNLSPNLADATITAAQFTLIDTRVEGYNYRRLKGRTATLSFWVYSNKIGTYCVAFDNSISDRIYITEYTINQVNTWEKKNVTVTFNQSGGTENYTTGVGIRIYFMLAAGTDLHGTANVWNSTGDLVTSNQVNFMDNAANQFYLTMVQLELGSVATDFEYRPIAEELTLCQRYFEKSYDLTTAPGTSTAVGNCQWLSNYTAQGVYFDNVSFNTRKRIAPTMIFYSTTGGANRIRNATAGSNITVNGQPPTGERGYSGPIPTVESMINGNSYTWQWTADARL